MEVVSDWRILLGKHNLSHNESTQRAYRVKQIHPHERLHENHSNRLDYDIVLVKPIEDVTANSFVRYACGPERGCSLHPGQSCRVTPWGDTTGIRALLVFKGQTGSALFSLKSKYAEKDYTAQPLPPTCLDEEAKYLKCRFLR